MKKLALITRTLIATVFALVLLTSATASAKIATNNNVPSANIRVDVFKAMDIRVYKANTQNTFRIAVNNPSGESFKVSIRNEQNQLLWWDTIKKSVTFSELFSLSKLPAGQYTLEVSNDMTSYTQLIEVK
jgi:hypothetical protein